MYVAELRRWQPVLNLVSARTLPDVWQRHVADCLQLLSLETEAERWLDLGSGAGLPGLIVAAAEPARTVTLIESDSRKCAFLRSTARLMGVEVRVVEGRIEEVLGRGDLDADVVTARGLAALPALLDYAQPILRRGAVGLFPKGKTFSAELTAARESWTFASDVIPSRTDPDARILRITNLASRAERSGNRA